MSATSMMIDIDDRRAGRARGQARIRAARPTREPVAGALRLTRRGRLVVTLVMTCLIVAAFMVSGGASVATREAGSPDPVRIVEVEQGQTLWQIAGTVAAPGETAEMVLRIRELNSLPGNGLVEGQELAVPVG
jgi:hypothetical protein